MRTRVCFMHSEEEDEGVGRGLLAAPKVREIEGATVLELGDVAKNAEAPTADAAARRKLIVFMVDCLCVGSNVGGKGHPGSETK
mmetsp:Transcript_26730/g.54675  ORF Transcript_26730/g.54675 Transcript_26730/m.54675 type:complete len:84 (+) Transcript_26730:1215-1466(+)